MTFKIGMLEFPMGFLPLKLPITADEKEHFPTDYDSASH
jgi:hypothetical protein